MQYYEYIRNAPVAELVKEHNKAKQNLILTKSDTARAELALLLIMPKTSFRDTGAALDLLNGFPKDAKLSASMLSFKHLLSALLAEQQLINGNVKELSQKLKNMDEQSQQLKNVKELSQKLKEEQKHSEVLENQIDNIKNMERNLILRDKP
ncbi:Exonuclease SbcC [Candidatus Nitrotoga sp. BS]|uniref:dihydrolipoamide acyltransferase n=1 Tax=Candidatus Nitrotoga sp. BS TaxID=2890408 RepID=UPI001EF186A4|nr:dihydrolipoamide acyltransferase [Candidatus Nitrotoga sp. BS]CAH1202328.1 Exonuclease SbcC [Candidatus Nitrotoga sp. BS]